VQALEDRLTALRYDVATIDGVYDQNTAYAVVAFQKVTGLRRTGRATQDVVDALAAPAPPPPLVPGGGPSRVEVDLRRQVLFLY
jgi:peptidoglycan hydrolase-like protein with peptidoglycan-binding domain